MEEVNGNRAEQIPVNMKMEGRILFEELHKTVQWEGRAVMLNGKASGKMLGPS